MVDAVTPAPGTDEGSVALDALLAAPGRNARVRHVHHRPASPGEHADWPNWSPPDLVAAWRDRGIDRPWLHQVHAAEHAWAGRHVVLSTGTASGKSLAYQLPVISAVLQPPADLTVRRHTALYLAPTKALAADQLSGLRALTSGGVPLSGLRPATYDGDTPPDQRRWVRDHAGLVLTNPDLLHHSLLPGHQRWAPFLRGLRFVVVDECHRYRGVFGAQVAAVLRRLRRVAARYGADPVFVLASATTAEPARTAHLLTGLDVVEVTDDASRRGATDLVLWEPPEVPDGSGARRTAVSEASDLLADLVCSHVRSLAFVRSRRGAEVVAVTARRLVSDVDPSLAGRIAAYRAGYLPEDRRALEEDLRSGRLLGMASTNALELGVDISGLDAVLVAGWPGTRSALWQQAGRAGRDGTRALAVLVADDDPLDSYLVRHPEALVGQPVEATVLDPDNPHVLAPHLCAAAAELPMTEADLPLFGPSTSDLLAVLVERGLLRRRPGGWYWTQQARATDLTDLRGTGGAPVRVVEQDTGRVVGTVDAGAADHTVHTGAVYLHLGSTYVVQALDLDERLALVRRENPPWSTSARSVGDIRVLDTTRTMRWGDVTLCLGTVDVTSRVTSYVVRSLPAGELLGEEPLDLPERRLRTTAVWWVLPPSVLEANGLDDGVLPGAVHAAEHAAIGLLPLVATCDRWDVGGVSTALHPDTGTATVFVHDGHPGGAGFAERGWLRARQWLQATLEAVRTCPCRAGCPACVQSPKCGNGNEPLDKQGAVRVLRAVLAGADDEQGDTVDSDHPGTSGVPPP